jgi:hypothetical protein
MGRPPPLRHHKVTSLARKPSQDFLQLRTESYDRRCFLWRSLRLVLLIALAFARRRSSLLETYQRRLRTELRIPLSDTRLRKRLSRLSCDSPGFSSTVIRLLSLLFALFSQLSSFFGAFLQRQKKTRLLASSHAMRVKPSFPNASRLSGKIWCPVQDNELIVNFSPLPPPDEM